MSSQPNNHLFIQWLKEWSDNFTKLGAKSAKTYKKAHESLTTTPRPFRHPSELIQLKFFGEKICRQLEKRLKEHCVANGLAMPISGTVEDIVMGSLETSRALGTESVNESTARKSPLTTNKKPKAKAKKSGAPSLVSHITVETDYTPATKAKSNSISIPENLVVASKRKAAISPDDLLPPIVKKKRKYVPRYRSGAYAILIALYKNNCFEEPFTKNEIIKHAEPLCDKPFESNVNAGNFYSAWGSMKTLVSNDLVYERGRPALYYITQEGKDVAAKIIQVENSSNSINEEDSNLSGNSNGSSFSSATSINTASSSAKTSINWPSESILPRRTRQISASTVAVPNNGTQLLSNPMGSEFLNQQTNVFRTQEAFELVNDESLRSPTVPISLQGVEEIASNLIIWSPGSFEISMILDNREIKSREQSDFFSERLQQNGVNNSTRALAVGDFVWIATHKVTGEEAILNFIVERKRIDDLKSSILDGRFREQKFRLKRSTVPNVVYLVEEPPGIRIEGMEQAIQTALSETVMVHDFFLIRTVSLDDSIKYLTKITQQLESQYKYKSLKIIPARIISEASDYMKLISNLREADLTSDISINYETFSAILSKGGLKTIRDVYIKMLMCVKGVTFEKAAKIQKLYPTPRHLIDAYNELPDVNAKKSLLFNQLGTDITIKKITKLLSEKVYQMWDGL